MRADAPLFLRSDAVAQLLGLDSADAFLARRAWMERAQVVIKSAQEAMNG